MKHILQQYGKEENLMLYFLDCPGKAIPEYVRYQLRKYTQAGIRTLLFLNCPTCETDGELIALREENVITDFVREKSFSSLFAILEKLLSETEPGDFRDVGNLILSNAQCFGPFVPVPELLKHRDESRCDFWGITRFTHKETLVEPYFISLSNRILRSPELREIFACRQVADAPCREKMNRVSIELAKRFSFSTYVTLQDERPIRVFRFVPPFSVNAADYLLRECGMPFLPLAAFKTALNHTFSICGNIIRELRARFPDYPDRLIFDYLRTCRPLSHLKNYPGVLQVLPEHGSMPEGWEGFRIAVKAHFFYADMLDCAFPYLRNIPCSFDLLCTVCSREVEQALQEKAHAALPRLRQLKVEVVQNRGRDIGPWLTAFRKEEEDYDLILKFQTKKRLQQPNPFGQAWNRYNDLCILASESYVAAIFRLFAGEERLGIVLPPYPPMITITSPLAYLGNLEMQRLFQEVGKKCAPNAPVETATPVFPAGTLFWYRPEAMKSLMSAGYTQESFPPEPLPPLTLAHVIERIVPYAAQSEGYYYKLAIPESEFLKGYLLMEDRLLSHAGGHAVPAETPQSLSRSGFRTLAKATVCALGLAVRKRVGRK